MHTAVATSLTPSETDGGHVRERGVLGRARQRPGPSLADALLVISLDLLRSRAICALFRVCQCFVGGNLGDDSWGRASHRRADGAAG
jgi:hypothetical protein